MQSIKLSRSYRKLAFSPKDNKIVLVGAGAMAIVDSVTGSVIKDERHQWWHFGICFSPSGEKFAASCAELLSDRPGPAVVRIFDSDSFKELLQLKGNTPKRGSPIVDVDFSPDGKRILTQGSSRIRVWDVESGRATVSPRNRTHVNGALFSSSGDAIIVNTAGGFKIWDLRPMAKYEPKIVQPD